MTIPCPVLKSVYQTLFHSPHMNNCNDVTKSFFFWRFPCRIDCSLWISPSLYVRLFRTTLLLFFPQWIILCLGGPLVQPQSLSVALSKLSLSSFHRPSTRSSTFTLCVIFRNSFANFSLTSCSFNFQTFLFGMKSCFSSVQNFIFTSKTTMRCWDKTS